MQKPCFILVYLCVAVLLLGGTALAERIIVINIPAFSLYLYDEGIPIRSFPISIGTELNPSVLGETTIVNKVIDPTYYPPAGRTPILPGPDNPVGTRWLGLGFPGYGIHGTNNPASIGSPASSGCIRMHNRDVEELTELVRVGTPVHLIYQTVLLAEDPLLHTKTITVYPDVYKQGKSEEQLHQELERSSWQGIHRAALFTLLRNPTGEAQCLPWEIPLSFNGERAAEPAVEWSGTFYVPYDIPFDPRNELALATAKWGEAYYLPLEIYLQSTGLGYSKTQEELVLHSPVGYVGEQFLGKALILEGDVYLQPQAPMRQFMPSPMQVISLWGEIYQPAGALLKEDSLSQLELKWPLDASYSW